MVEVELKFRVGDVDELLVRLVALGASLQGEFAQHDVYFAHPLRDFARTDEALRVRLDSGQPSLCYKGPKLDAVSKSREELDIELSGGEAAFMQTCSLLARLGFQQVRRVEKRRSSWACPTPDDVVMIAVDDVAGLGMFVELELITAPAEWEAARDRLQRLAGTLGLADAERRSYLELLMESDGGR